MKKSGILLLSIVFSLVLPFTVKAATADTPVGTGLTQNMCSSKPYQDDLITTNGQSYFSQCIKAACKNNKYELNKNYPNKKVICLNGNSDPYIVLKKNGCSNYEDKTCSGGDVRYCSQVVSYDCTRKSSGASFTTTTKSTTTKTTKPIITNSTTTTTTTKLVDLRLKSLSLSNGIISFNPDIYEYVIEVNSDVTSINVNAVPMVELNEVTVTGNDNIDDGSVINITVKSSDNRISIYKITVKKLQEVILSSNNKLKSLFIEGYTLPFDSSILNYSIIIDSDVSSLNISYETEDENSFVEVIGNENLEDGRRITISITAEDGSVRDYTIDVIVKKSSNALSIIFIIIIILALGAGGFYVYKKFFEGKKGEKYEYE